jgi:hypothetical protein
MDANTIQKRISIRYSDPGSAPIETSDRIQGFETEPLVSLEDAVKPLVKIVPNVEQMVSGVKPLCVELSDGLSIDELASIKLYTLEWNPHETSFYINLNEKLRSGTREELKHWFLYLRLFTAALSKLPLTTTNQTVYRGVKKDISSQYPIGETCVCPPFLSCSSSIGIINDFLDQTGPRTLFTIISHTGKKIGQHSYLPGENEILLRAMTHFRVVTNSDQGNGLHLVQLEEIEHPTTLIPSRNQPLVNQIEKCSILSQIDLRGQNLTDEDTEIVVEKAIISKKCSELHLQTNKITSKGASTIALGLKNNITLQKLWLDSNNISDIGVNSLAKILSENNSSLKMLGLNSNSITDEGAKHLAEMLKINKILTLLRLTHNSLTDQGVQYLANTLTHHNNILESIDLSSNKFITDLSIDYLVQMILRNQRLSSLSLSNCGLSEDGKQRFRAMGQAKYGFKLSL